MFNSGCSMHLYVHTATGIKHKYLYQICFINKKHMADRTKDNDDYKLIPKIKVTYEIRDKDYTTYISL